MDLSDLTRAVTPTLDGPALAALAASGRPLTVGDVARASARGSEIGIRRALVRLVAQGIVREIAVGRLRVYELNRDHIASGIAEALSGLRLELWRRMRIELEAWDVAPVYAAIFGSAARGDGDVDSDIDLLLVHAPLSGEPAPVRGPTSRDRHGDEGLWAAARAGVADSEDWYVQVDGLRAKVLAWTGNPLQVVDLSMPEWHVPQGHEAMLADVSRDGIVLVGAGGPSARPAAW